MLCTRGSRFSKLINELSLLGPNGSIRTSIASKPMSYLEGILLHISGNSLSKNTFYLLQNMFSIVFNQCSFTEEGHGTQEDNAIKKQNRSTTRST